jgi:epoxyqueuosine reductase
MEEKATKKGVSRRDFLKLGALVGVAAQAVAIPTLAHKAGSSHDSYTGWESFEGDTQFFNRKPFELPGGKEELYEKFYPKVDTVRRPNPMTDISWTRAGRMGQILQENPDWKLEDGMDAIELPPDLKAYYKVWDEKGQNRFETDVLTNRVSIPAWVANHEKYDDHFALSSAYFGAWQDLADNYPEEPTAPPEVSDFQYVDHGHMLDLREVNKECKERGAMLAFRSPDHATELVKKTAHLYGATVVGITTLNPDYVYDKNLRGSENPMEEYEVPEHWKYAIVVGVPHEWDQLASNPQYGDSLDAYMRVRMTAYRITQFLRRLGYPARFHTPPYHYDLVVPPIAVEAGLGQWGRNGTMITPETGPNMRLAVVTTNLDMTIDKPIDFGVAEFCADCKICAEQCPSGAISFADGPEGMEQRGINHWYMDTSKCYSYWMESMGPLGCRLCITNCVYSRKNNWVHGVARVADPVDPTGLVNNALIWMQKTFFDHPTAEEYRRPPDGCFASYRPAPEWLQTDKWFNITTDNPQMLCNS